MRSTKPRESQPPHLITIDGMPHEESRLKAQTYESVQYLRAIAALLVVFHHARNRGHYFGLKEYAFGAGGVHIFFVISGFIMYVAARRESPRDFVSRRLQRILPFYWLATLAWFAWPSSLTGQPSNMSVVGPVVKSLFFIPYFSPFNPGQIWPYLIPGWTLTYELLFYAVFAVGIIYRRPLMVCAAIFIIAALAGFALAPQSAVLRTLSNPIALEFVAGIWLAKLTEAGLSRWMIILLPVGSVAFLLSDFTSLPAVVRIGVPSLMLVAGAIALEQASLLPKSRVLKALGDASYMVYLFHLFAISLVKLGVEDVHVAPKRQLVIMIVGSVILSAVVGYLIHVAAERPMLRAFRANRGRSSAS